MVAFLSHKDNTYILNPLEKFGLILTCFCEAGYSSSLAHMHKPATSCLLVKPYELQYFQFWLQIFLFSESILEKYSFWLLNIIDFYLI